MDQTEYCIIGPNGEPIAGTTARDKRQTIDLWLGLSEERVVRWTKAVAAGYRIKELPIRSRGS